MIEFGIISKFITKFKKKVVDIFYKQPSRNRYSIKAMDYSILDLANKIIEKSQSRNIRLGLTRLQKLVYYVYGEYLAQEKIRLVKDDEPKKMFFGPVFPKLCKLTESMDEIKTIHKSELEKLDNIEIESGKNVSDIELDDIIDKVFREHGQKTARALSNDTSKKGYAWDRARYFMASLLDEDIINDFSKTTS